MAEGAAQRELERQERSNRNSLASHALFAGHREHLTQTILERLSAGGERLCVLGAGNCHDLDLARLAQRYREIHLVDLDARAIEQARERQAPELQARLCLHGGLDLSQMLAELDDYRALRLTPERLAQHPERTAERMVRALGSGFDAVVSACVLSQMQLAVRSELSAGHPLFAAASYTLTLTHLRTLSARLAPRARALVVSDVASEQLAPLATLGADADLCELLASLVLSGDVFDSVDPLLLSQMSLDDPTLARDVSLHPIRDVWLWQLSRERRYLVYALLLERNSPAL